MTSHTDAENVITDEPEGTYACPICGLDRPHYHPDEQVAAYREDQVRSDGWTSTAHRLPKKRGFYLCLGVEVDPNQFGTKKDFWTPNARWSQLAWFKWVRDGGANYIPERQIQEVLYLEDNYGQPYWRLRNLLGNAVPSGVESRFAVRASPKFWRNLPEPTQDSSSNNIHAKAKEWLEGKGD